MTLAAWVARVPIVRFMRHTLAQLNQADYATVDRWMLRRCGGLIFVSDFVGDEVREKLQRCPASVTLYNPQPVIPEPQSSSLSCVSGYDLGTPDQ